MRIGRFFPISPRRFAPERVPMLPLVTLVVLLLGGASPHDVANGGPSMVTTADVLNGGPSAAVDDVANGGPS
jgi:hypothetical protein